MNASISYIVPLYNEEKNVKNIISSIVQVAPQLSSEWEIIAIESGSCDNTWQELKKIGENNINIRLVHQKKKEGMGSALRCAYIHASKEIICHVEADRPFAFDNLNKVIPILTTYDLVIGYRIGIDQSNKWRYHNMNRLQMLMRYIYHVSYNALIRIFFSLHVRDVNFSFKLFKRKLLSNIQLESQGWFIDAELLLEFKRIGVLPIEVPIRYQDRTDGNSSVHIFSACRMLNEMFKYYIRRRAQ